MAPVIRVEGIGKSYRVNHAEERLPYQTLRDTLARAATAPIRRWRAGGHAGVVEQFWALKDVSFDVQPGEVVGIIGRNGAGKSTLLKILSRITKPTCGQAVLRGRVGSLLEVGTGFHPELTGRENIYMNGSILGMGRLEIRSKFDEIVAFSGVERFLDTPVKRYSSGMQVRLAFAVAAHLEPEIIVVDEVLAVGDMEFQKKCLGKMGDVARSGRTVLFVSHDIRNVVRLCGRGILLKEGQIEAIGDIHDVTAKYVHQDSSVGNGYIDLSDRADRSGSAQAQFGSITFRQQAGPTARLVFGAPLSIDLAIEVSRFIGPYSVCVLIVTSEGTPVHDFWNDSHTWSGEVGLHTLSITIPQLRLYPGSYFMSLWMGDQTASPVDYIRNAASFEVVQTPESGILRPLRQSHGIVYQESRWECKPVGENGVQCRLRHKDK